MLPPGAIFKLKIHQNVYADPTGGKLQSSPRPPSGFSLSRFAAGEGRRKGEKEEKEEKGRGLRSPTFFYNLTTAQQCIVAATYTRSLDL